MEVENLEQWLEKKNQRKRSKKSKKEKKIVEKKWKTKEFGPFSEMGPNFPLDTI